MTRDPDTLRQTAQQARETARLALDSADALDITANLLDRLMAAEVDEVLARTQLEAARRSGNAGEAEAADEDLVRAQADVAVLEHVLEDPLDLSRFTGCPAWSVRLTRPEVYRRVLAAHAEGKAVSPEAHAIALAAARAAVQLDAALIGDAANV